jgi:hypothetical protein
MMSVGVIRSAAAFPPPPCGEGLGVGVVQEEAKRAKLPYAELRRPFLNHPHPYPPHKGEGAETSRVFDWKARS